MTKFMYMAEAKRSKSSSYFESTSLTSASQEEDGKKQEKEKKADQAGDEYVYHENWGETLSEKHHVIPVVFDMTSHQAACVDFLPKDYSYGQAKWITDNKVVLVGWKETPYRLGLIYCNNRPSEIFIADLQTKQFEVVGSKSNSDKPRAVNNPSVSHSGDIICWFESPAFGPHARCKQLLKYSISSKTTDILVDIVPKPLRDWFQGIFVPGSSSTIYWGSHDMSIYFSSVSGNNLLTLRVNTISGEVDEVGFRVSGWCNNVLDVKTVGDKDLLLVMRTYRLTSPFLQLNIVEYPYLPARSPKDLTMPHFSLNDAIVNVFGSGSPRFESILLRPTSFKPLRPTSQQPPQLRPPLIVFPHGGPHAASMTNYFMETAFFASLGIAVLLVNYRGSTGRGQDFVESLPGHVGDFDVEDVNTAVKEVIAEDWVDPDQIFYLGGSHGGFIGMHSIAKYPDLYKAAVLSNGVMDLTSMVATSDIRDWIFAVSDQDFSYSKLPGDTLSDMWKQSPVGANLDKVKTPCLFIVGDSDLRVPPSQTHMVDKMLRARGVETKVLKYPGNGHRITKPAHRADEYCNIIKWFVDHGMKLNIKEEMDLG